MDNIKRLDYIIKEKKWIRNDIGMGKIQCSKLINLKGELILIISSEVNEKPVWARVEKILVVNGEIILFYDGEYCVELEHQEYEEYKEFVEEDEWNCLFEEGNVSKLIEKDLISSNDGFYVEAHENINNYEEEYDDDESNRLNEHFNI